MRKTIVIAVIVLFCVAVAFAGTFGKMDLKVGDEVYACNCEGCPCQDDVKDAGQVHLWQGYGQSEGNKC